MADFDDSLDPRDPEIEYADEKRPLREGYYGTGSTEPPKDHMGVVGLVLVLFISFSSLISALGLMNIQVFQVPETTTPETMPGLSFRGEVSLEGDIYLEDTGENRDPTVLEPSTPVLEGVSTHLKLNAAPPGKENTAQVPNALSWQAVYEKVMPSVVSITCTTDSAISTGSGVIMDTSGAIITNAHVVEGAQRIEVLLTDGRELEARCVGYDTLSDLAVLRIFADNLVPAEFGDSSTLRVGDAVVAIGDPLGVELRGTMTDGMISGINRDIKVGSKTMTLLQTTAALNTGNSGGPLVNCYGQVVGINTMKIDDYASEGGVEGLSFAIPMTAVQVVVEQLANQGYVSGRPALGIAVERVDTLDQIYFRMPAGLEIKAVDPESSVAGVLRRGDILRSINGLDVRTLSDLEEIIYACAVGDELTAVIFRNGMEFETAITVDEAKKG